MGSPRTATRLAGGLFAAVLTLGLLEGALRLAPGLVPLGALERFHRELRLEIAQRRHLPNESVVQALPRDDDGPELLLFRPHVRLDFDYRDEGAERSVVTDSTGFCNPHASDPGLLPRVDVVAIGDSFTWCSGLRAEDAWPAQLAQRLARTVWNLGRGGIGLHEELQILRRFGLAKRPRVVILNFYEGNDLRDALRFAQHASATPAERQALRDATRARQGRAEHAAALDHPLGRHSYAFDLLAVGIELGLEALRPSPAARADPRAGVNFRYRLAFADGMRAMNPSNADRDEVVAARALLAGETDAAVLDGPLAAFAALARERGFTALLSYSPSAYTAYAEVVAFEDPAVGEALAAYSRTLRAHVRQAAERDHLRLLDLTEPLQAAVRARPGEPLLYFPDHVHYTPEGSRVVADAVADALRDVGWEP